MDIVGFTPLAREAHPQDVMKMLNELFSQFDRLCDIHGVYKASERSPDILTSSVSPARSPGIIAVPCKVP